MVADPIDARAWPHVDLAAAESENGSGNGNGAHADGTEPSGATEDVASDDAAGLDIAARLAFLAGETIDPTELAESTASAAEPADAAPSEGPLGDPALPAAAAAEPVEVDPAPADSAIDAPPAAETAAPTPESVTPAEVDDQAVTGSTRTSDLLRRFRPGQNIDAELAEFEAALTPDPVPVEPQAAAAEASPPPVAADAVDVADPTALVEAAAEPNDAAPPVLMEPAAAAAEPTPAAGSAAAASDADRDDVVAQPTWQTFAPDQAPVAPAATAPAAAPPALPGKPGVPQWPARPEVPESPAMALLASRARPSGSDGLWAASAREVLAPLPGTPAPAPGATAGGVRPCASCGLSLSATARFCRRCGSPQA